MPIRYWSSDVCSSDLRWRKPWRCGSFDLFSNEHGTDAALGAVVEAGFSFPVARVAEGAEDHVPERQVAVIVAVNAALVVQGVAFRTDDQIAEPMGRLDVGMLEHRQKCDDDAHHDRRLGGKAERAEERRVGKECGSKCKTRGAPK